ALSPVHTHGVALRIDDVVLGPGAETPVRCAMEDKWLLIWILAPIFSPAAIAIEAYSLRWYGLDETASGGLHAYVTRNGHRHDAVFVRSTVGRSGEDTRGPRSSCRRGGACRADPGPLRSRRCGRVSDHRDRRRPGIRIEWFDLAA